VRLPAEGDTGEGDNCKRKEITSRIEVLFDKLDQINSVVILAETRKSWMIIFLAGTLLNHYLPEAKLLLQLGPNFSLQFGPFSLKEYKLALAEHEELCLKGTVA
jgi:hypothetical protein